MKEAVSALVADEHFVFADALSMALGCFEEIRILEGRPATGAEAVQAVLEQGPDVAVLDLWLQGMGGAAAARRIRAQRPGQPILMLGWFHRPRDVADVLHAGAAAFLSKDASVEQVLDAILRVSRGERMELFQGGEQLNVPPDPEREEAWQRLTKLTPRELEILQMLAFGRSAAQISEALSIALPTTRTHIHRILDKTGTQSQTEAVILAIHFGVIHA